MSKTRLGYVAAVIIVLLALITAGCASSKAGVVSSAAGEDDLVATRVDKAPAIDGQANDEAWKSASEKTVALTAEPGVKAQEITVKALSDGKYLYLLAQYQDENPLKFNKAWEYDGTAWQEGSYDDTLALVWDINGSVTDFDDKGLGVMTKGLAKGDDVFDFTLDVSKSQPATGKLDFWGW